MKHSYDTIGRGYSQSRRADPRIARQILEALGDAATVVNLGAGAGSYEPRQLAVLLEESASNTGDAARRAVEGLKFGHV